MDHAKISDVQNSKPRRRLLVAFFVSIVIVLSYVMFGPREGLMTVDDLANKDLDGSALKQFSVACEEFRNNSRFLKERTVTIAAGARRSGSTWQYAALINLARHMNIVHRAMCLYDDEENPLGNFPSPKQIHNKQAIILKSHIYDVRLDLMATYVFTSYRDIRDELISIINKDMRRCSKSPEKLYGLCRQILHTSFMNQLAWNERTDYTFRYEDLRKTPHVILKDMAMVLGFELSQVDITSILSSIERDLNVTREVIMMDHSNPYFFVTRDHKSSNLNRANVMTKLPDAVLECLNFHYHEWLTSKGYVVGKVPKKLPQDCEIPRPQHTQPPPIKKRLLNANPKTSHRHHEREDMKKGFARKPIDAAKIEPKA
eukprot:TRINITY_DN6662_c0_g1_i2.p1 TRINITY_DN6662_c0_g1~~TRINITY_DN6662_c0_g1_i2.p1  ORF type:complete len:372 (-),score=73.59 TRINITY_DN6662_c0_g1_i2:581-1696(-)